MNPILLAAMLNWNVPVQQDTLTKIKHPHDNMPIYQESGRSVRMPSPSYYFEITPKYRLRPSQGGSQPADSTSRKKLNWL